MIVLLWIFRIINLTTGNDVCDLPVIENGRCEALRDIISISCGVGYKLSPPEKSQIICQTDKAYYRDLPTCSPIDCALPSSAKDIEPDYISDNVSYVRPSKKLSLNCPEDYSSPIHNAMCITDTTFSEWPLPSCQSKNCVKHQTRNGQITSQHLSPGTKVLIECDEGFKKADPDLEVVCISGNLFSSNPNLVCRSVPCPAPKILNGYSLQNTTLPGQTLQYQCDTNYDKSTLSVICKSGHKYHDDVVPGCTPKDCPGRGIENGYMRPAEPRQHVVIECNEGYEVEGGKSEVTCISNNHLYPEQLPSCIEKCCSVPNIENGERIHIENGKVDHGDVVTIRCGDNYRLSGSSDITCHKGAYQPAPPQCLALSCQIPLLHLGNVLTLNNRPLSRGQQYHEVAPSGVLHIACADSYELSNQTTVTCISKNIVNPPLQSLPKCIPVACVKKTLDNGLITTEGILSPNRSLTIQCNAGFILSHDETSRCVSGSKFDPPLPQCQALPCPVFSLSNGTVDYTRDYIDPGDSVYVFCDANFRLEGSGRVTCVAGDKTTTKPKCLPRDCPRFTIEHGEAFPAKPRYPIEVECEAGYKLVGPLQGCVAGSVREGPLPSCNPQPCPIPTVQHGSLAPANHVQPGSHVTVTCQTNYQLSHSLTVTCVTENTFNPALPSCQPKNCVIGEIENSTNIHVRSYRPGEGINIQCKRGYKKNYDNIVTCVAGSLTNPSYLSQCQAQPCGLSRIEQSNIITQLTLAPGQSTSIVCDKGYQISSNMYSTVTCITDTIFTSPIPQCQAVPCAVPSIPNSRIENYGEEELEPGEVLSLQCDTDYTISHSEEVRCVTDTTFHPALPSCNDRDCSVPELLDGSIVNHRPGEIVRPDTRLQVSCDPGYDLAGSNTVTCIRANTFRPVFDSISCSARPCTTQSTIRHGRFLHSTVNPGHVIQVACDPNYSLSFSERVYCITDTQYSTDTMGRIKSDLPFCKPMPCRTPTIQNGVGLGPITPGEGLRVSCQSGYTQTGEDVRCVAGSTFSGALPRCSAQPCRVPSSVPHSLPSTTSTIAPGTILEMRCDPNYLLSGNTVRCVTLEQFSGPLPSCNARECRLPLISHGRWGSDRIRPSVSTQLTCNEGYTISGNSHVRCVSGQKFHPEQINVQCIENCDLSTAVVPNGYLQPVSGDQTVRPGDKLRVVCNYGYRPVASDQVVTCSSAAHFSPGAIRGCQAEECPLPDPPQHGGFTTAPRDYLAPGERLEVTCEAGFTVSGPSQVTCLTRDVFSGDLPGCVASPCPIHSGDVVNGTVVPGDLTLLQPGEKLEYRCKDGYYNTESANVFCVTQDRFTADFPVCKPVSCPAPYIQYGVVATPTSPGGHLNITCQPGLVLHPQVKVTCETEHLFIPRQLPECRAVSCLKPDIPHGQVGEPGLIEPGDEVGIVCDPNYRLSTSSRVICVSGEVYSTGHVEGIHTFPLCTPIPCEKPIVHNGIVEGEWPIEPGNRVQVRCGADYNLVGPKYMECTSSSLYINRNSTACVPKNCEAPEVKNGLLSSSYLTPGKVVSVVCHPGYKVDCDVPVTCISANNFQPIKIPQCLPQDCKKPVIQDGVVTGPHPLTPNTTLIIQCNSGYTLTNITPVTCTTLEQYSPTTLPHCVPIRNCTVPHIPHGVYLTSTTSSKVEPGTRLRYQCIESGYSPHLSDEVQCLSSDFFHPAKPQCLTKIEAKLLVNSSLDTIYKEAVKDGPVQSEDSKSTSPFVWIVLVIFLLVIVFAIILIYKKKSYRRKLLLICGSGGGGFKDRYKPLPTVQKKVPPTPVTPASIEVTIPRKAPPRPSAPPAPDKRPSDPITSAPSKQSTKTSRSTKKQEPVLPLPKQGRRKKRNVLYPNITSSSSSEVATDTKITDTELSTFKPKPRKPKPVQKPVIKPIATSQLRNSKHRSAFRAVGVVSPGLPEPVSGSVNSNLSDLDSIDGENYDEMLESVGLTKDDFKLNISRDTARYFKL